MKNPLKIGVVGCGYWGPNLVRNFRALADCRMLAICDQDPKRLNHLKQLYPDLETYTDFGEFLQRSGVDAVVVATPVRFHHPLARECLLQGKHVFIEKPMADSTKSCEDLVALAEKNACTLMIGHTFLYSSAVRKIKELIGEKHIGDIRYISSRRLNLGLFQKDINVTWDLAPHDISIILHLMEESPSSVNCQGAANVTAGIEDITNLSLIFPSGRFACIQSSWLDPRKVREMTIVGTNRMIVYDDIEPLQKIKIFDHRVEKPPHYDTFGEFTYAYHYGDVLSPYIKQEEPLRVECQHFVDCIRKREPPISNGRQGLQLVQILEAASVSLRNGGSRVDLAPM